MPLFDDNVDLNQSNNRIEIEFEVYSLIDRIRKNWIIIVELIELTDLQIDGTWIQSNSKHIYGIIIIKYSILNWIKWFILKRIN